MTLSIAKKFAELLSALRLNTPQVRRALRALERLFVLAVAGRKDNIVLISAPTRTGKTTSVQMFLAKHPPYNDPLSGDLQQPVVVVVVPEKCTTKALAYAVLEQLRVPFVRAPERELVNLMKYNMRKQGVQILILDELQHMIENRSNKRRFAQGTTDWIKVLTTEGVCSVVGVGVESAELFLQSNEQFVARLSSLISLDPLDVNDKKDFALFVAMLDKIQEAMKGLVDIDFAKGDLPRRMMIAAKGRIGLLIKLIQDAGMNAILDNRQTVTHEDLDQVWRGSLLRKDPLNELFNTAAPLKQFMPIKQLQGMR